ncbi:protein ycf2 [Phtheirospermum japonicum]|uniref:Protein ycf2 n=1 Tax=Phtheirospermum japonicum TaxID=374723 RepID=A0A830CR15_9LAMI|nr:protein ycf2 [Phtheirospermum japonicum]
MIVSKGPMNWDFPIGPGHFRASGSFMMKRMSFKRMIRSSCRVEPCSTKHVVAKASDFKPRGAFVIKLKHSLYGLKQSIRMWYNSLSDYLIGKR